MVEEKWKMKMKNEEFPSSKMKNEEFPSSKMEMKMKNEK